jgi:glutamate-ammonia-ligase adenylyltransferase
MQSLSELLCAEPFHEDAVHARLETWGFTEILEPRKPIRRAFSHQRPVGARRTRAGSTPGPAPARPTARAAKLIDGLASSSAEREALFKILDELLEDLSRAADPLKALLNFSRLCDVIGDRTGFFRRLNEHPSLRERVTHLLGWAQSLADTLIRDPDLVDALAAPAAIVSRPDLQELAQAACSMSNSLETQLNALRRFRRRQTLRIGLLDMERATWRSEKDFHVVVRQISDLAQVCVAKTLCLLAPDASNFAVIALGKMGARELNYSSDIDLIFLQNGQSESEIETLNTLGQELFKALNDTSSEGALYRVDMRLRPEGASGPLVTPLDYALSYYESYAGAWEWQALIKARGVAGDAKLAKRFRRFTRGVTWAKRTDDGHLQDMIEMKRRVESTPDGADVNNVKMGPGAIRDAEWVVQQLQMMVGPTHARARAKDTLRAIEVLSSLATLTHDEARNLRESYLFLRTLEHRLQLWEEQAVRILPQSENARASLARRLGCVWKNSAAARWLMEEHERHRADVRVLCEKLFWGWREEKGGGGRMKDELNDASSSFIAHHSSLHRLAEGTPAQPLPAPLSRQIKAVLPAVAEHAARAADPDRALLNLERLCEAGGNRLSLLRALADTPRLARGVLTILGGSQVLADTLVRFPELLDLTAQRALLDARKIGDAARADCRSYCLTFRDRRAALRRWKAREILRIGLRDLVLDASPHDISGEIASLCGACLDFATDEIKAQLQPASHNIAFGVLGMGKLGGREMHYSSDADVIFVHESFTGENSALATRWATELIRFMGERTEDGIVFDLDPRLRPEGASGALAPTLASFTQYFERVPNGLEVWERQALTRARFVAGDSQISARLMAAIRHVAFPETWNPAWSGELRHIKARVENERGAKSKSGAAVFDVKLGAGALSDIEWTTQWLALKFGAHHPVLQTRSTLLQIEAAREAGVLPAPDATALRDAYTFLRRAELRLQIAHEYSTSTVTKDSKEWTAWTRAVFPEESETTAAEKFESQWNFHTQATRKIFEKVRDEL